MNSKDSLGDRMKQYEYVSRTFLTRRIPIIIRIDGKAFHTFTKGFQKPFDNILVKSMQATMQFLCENIQGCVLGYTQSDEITLVLTDYKNRDTSAWFESNIQKMVSVSASMATLAFNKEYRNLSEEFRIKDVNLKQWEDYTSESDKKLADVYKKKIGKALFDSRVFSIPKEEVVNCLIWRQQDATRNSIESVGQAHFSSKQLHKKTCNDIQDMLMLEKGINWNDIAPNLKRGSCCTKSTFKLNEGTDRECVRSKWFVDNDIPIFTADKEYIEKWL